MSFDWISYFSLICSIGGIIFFVYSLVLVNKIKALFSGTNILKKWIIIQALIIRLGYKTYQTILLGSSSNN